MEEDMGFFDIFKKKKKNDNKEIISVRLLFDYCSNNIFFYDLDGNMIIWGDSLIPPEWQADAAFMAINEKLCRAYDGLFCPGAREISYVGFKSNEEREEFKKLVDEFVNLVYKKAENKYEITNDYNLDDLK